MLRILRPAGSVEEVGLKGPAEAVVVVQIVGEETLEVVGLVCPMAPGAATLSSQRRHQWQTGQQGSQQSLQTRPRQVGIRQTRTAPIWIRLGNTYQQMSSPPLLLQRLSSRSLARSLMELAVGRVCLASLRLHLHRQRHLEQHQVTMLPLSHRLQLHRSLQQLIWLGYHRLRSVKARRYRRLHLALI